MQLKIPIIAPDSLALNICCMLHKVYKSTFLYLYVIEKGCNNSNGNFLDNLRLRGYKIAIFLMFRVDFLFLLSVT